jgi:hypothetical protein
MLNKSVCLSLHYYRVYQKCLDNDISLQSGLADSKPYNLTYFITFIATATFKIIKLREKTL